MKKVFLGLFVLSSLSSMNASAEVKKISVFGRDSECYESHGKAIEACKEYAEKNLGCGYYKWGNYIHTPVASGGCVTTLDCTLVDGGDDCDW